MARKNLRLYVICPQKDNEFFNDLYKGIAKAQEELQEFGVKVEYLYTKEFNSPRQVYYLSHVLDYKPDGIAMIPSSSTNLNFVIDQAVESEIPVVTFNNDAPYSKRFCYIGHNNYEDGKKCANLIANMIDNRGEIIILSSNLEVYSLKQRVAGFRDKIKADYPDIKIAEIIENKDQRSYEYAKKQMGENNKIRGIFITTGGLTSKWPWFLENTDFKVQPKVIGYDNREETSQSLKDGLVHGLVHQNPYQQGYLAIKTLYECVAKGVKPDGENVYVESRIEII